MTLPFIVSLSHCARELPPSIRPSIALCADEIRQSVDEGTEEIFGALPALGIVKARWSRLLVDLNRGPDQTGPMGVIPEKDYHGRRVYRPGQAPDQETTAERVRIYYRPFHERLKEALGRPGVKGLVDAHSLNGVGPAGAPDAGEKRKDIVLSNNGNTRGEINPARGPTTCAAETLGMMKGAFERQGFSVSVNHPYSGGFIITHYGKLLLTEGKVAVQIEINQDLFLKAGTGKISTEAVEEVKDRVARALREIGGILA